MIGKHATQPCNECKLGVVHCMLHVWVPFSLVVVLQTESMIACKACSANIATAVDASDNITS